MIYTKQGGVERESSHTVGVFIVVTMACFFGLWLGLQAIHYYLDTEIYIQKVGGQE